MIISRTPFRISFFGGGTDYPAWYRSHGGAVLATTIDKYAYLTCRYLPPFFDFRYRVVWSKIENCHAIDEIEHPAVREIIRFLKIDRGMEIHHVGDLPARSGVGSSSTFVVGLLHALYALKGVMPDRRQLANEGIYVEQEILKETVGSQDQLMAAEGGFNNVLFHPNGEITVRPMTLGEDRTRELDSHLMLFYTGIMRTASDIAAGYVQDIHSREQQLLRIREMVDEGISILNSDDNIGRFGELLHQAWEVKRGLASKISNPHIQEIYDQALTAGAIGGKLLGAGGGGFMVLFVPPANHERVKERLNRLLHVPFKFESSGSQIIFFEPEEDYASEHDTRLNQTIEAFRELDHSRV